MKAIFIKQDFETKDLEQLNIELSIGNGISNVISVENGYILIVS